VGKTIAGTPFMMMELLEGRDVASILRQGGALAPGRAVHLIAQACEALEEAHARKIVHRDLKPENLFVCSARDGSEWLKILDFGISKVLEEEPMEQQLTRQGTTVGTPEYMSPEQLRAASDLDARADIYSLGCVMYEMLTGRRPFYAPAYADLVVMVMKQAPTPVQKLMPHVPQTLAAIVERAMAKDKTQRIASAKQFRELLIPFLPQRANYHDTIAIQPDSPSSTSLGAHFGPPSARPQPSQIGWVLLAIASVLIMAGVLIWFFTRG
jgi:serine/threonine-protein kinase